MKSAFWKSPYEYVNRSWNIFITNLKEKLSSKETVWKMSISLSASVKSWWKTFILATFYSAGGPKVSWPNLSLWEVELGDSGANEKFLPRSPLDHECGEKLGRSQSASFFPNLLCHYFFTIHIKKKVANRPKTADNFPKYSCLILDWMYMAPHPTSLTHLWG
jgi:hypothetical protein